MANNYTDIPTGEEQGLVSDTMKNVSTKKDTNFYLKLACVGLLCVVAFMSGNVHSRNTVTSMVNYASGNCQAVSSENVRGFCPEGIDPPCLFEETGVEECIQHGGGTVGCLDPNDAKMYLMVINDYTPTSVFFDDWKLMTCEEQGYPNVDRRFDYGVVFPDFIRKNILMGRFGQGTESLVYRK